MGMLTLSLSGSYLASFPSSSAVLFALSSRAPSVGLKNTRGNYMITNCGRAAAVAPSGTSAEGLLRQPECGDLDENSNGRFPLPAGWPTARVGDLLGT